MNTPIFIIGKFLVNFGWLLIFCVVVNFTIEYVGFGTIMEFPLTALLIRLSQVSILIIAIGFILKLIALKQYKNKQENEK